MNKKFEKKFKTKGNGKSFEGKAKIYDYDKVKSNDIKWWNQNSPQYELATKVPNWAHIQGAPYDIGKTVPVSLEGRWASEFLSTGSYKEDVNTMPGAMCLRYYPTIGISKDSTSPFNKALNILMSTLYSKTSGSALEFQQSNLAMYAVCMSNLASLFAEAKRALGVKDFWVTRNLNYPRTLFKALGFNNYDDMCKRFNEYVSRLNDLIAQFNSIKIPSWFNIFARHYSLSKNIYLDENSDFGQLYFFRAGGIWQYFDTAIPSRAKFKTIDRFDTMDDLLNLIQESLALWLNSQDLYKINGAISRAFGDGAFIMIDPMLTTDRIAPATDEFLSQQVMNTVLNGKVKELVTADPSLWDITEVPEQNAIIFAPTMTYNAGVNAGKGQTPEAIFVRAFDESPSAEDNMEMTRLSAIYKTTPLLNEDGDFENDYTLELVSCGTEIITDLEVYFPGTDADMITVSFNCTAGDANNAAVIFNDIKALSAFRFIPRYVIGYLVGDERRYIELGDQYNYCVLHNADLINLHNTALYSIWKPVIK